MPRAEVAEIPFAATSKKKAEQVSGRPVVRRSPDLSPSKNDGQETLSETWLACAVMASDPARAAATLTKAPSRPG